MRIRRSLKDGRSFSDHDVGEFGDDGRGLNLTQRVARSVLKTENVWGKDDGEIFRCHKVVFGVSRDLLEEVKEDAESPQMNGRKTRKKIANVFDDLFVCRTDWNRSEDLKERKRNERFGKFTKIELQ